MSRKPLDACKRFRYSKQAAHVGLGRAAGMQRRAGVQQVKAQQVKRLAPGVNAIEPVATPSNQRLNNSQQCQGVHCTRMQAYHWPGVQ